MIYKYLNKNPELFPSVIGITKEQFLKIHKIFEKELSKAEYDKSHSVKRIRSEGAGRKSTLRNSYQKLFFILFYYKVYPTYRLAEVVFELDHANVYRWKIFLEGVLKTSLKQELYLPEVQTRTLTDVFKICPLLKNIIIDSTERPIRRPSNDVDQKKYYSGKKKDHTVKTQIAVSPYGKKKILFISKTINGRVHDKTLAEMTLPYTNAKPPPNSTLCYDLGYLGIDHDHSIYKKHIHPFKKLSHKDLSEKQKGSNRIVSSVRVRVEHPFAYMKHFNILRHDFRNKLEYVHTPFEIIACIYNFTRK